MFASDHRQVARDNLQGNWGLSIGVAAMAVILGGCVAGSSFLPKLNIDLKSISLSDLTLPLRNATLSLSMLGIISFILGGVLELGHARYLLDQHEHRELRFDTLFSMFHYFGTGFCQQFLRSLYIALWSLLLVFPGAIASYRYAMTPFILAEHPDMTASDAIKASSDLMAGHKWELFCLDLSFLGWIILCAITANLGNLALNPYRSAARASFYRELCREKAAAK